MKLHITSTEKYIEYEGITLGPPLGQHFELSPPPHFWETMSGPESETGNSIPYYDRPPTPAWLPEDFDLPETSDDEATPPQPPQAARDDYAAHMVPIPQHLLATDEELSTSDTPIPDQLLAIEEEPVTPPNSPIPPKPRPRIQRTIHAIDGDHDVLGTITPEIQAEIDAANAAPTPPSPPPTPPPAATRPSWSIPKAD